MNLLFVTFAAALVVALCGCGEVQGDKFCARVTKENAIHLVSGLTTKKSEDAGVCTTQQCTECYTKSGTGTYIEYFAVCGDASGLSGEENKKWTCDTTAVCNSANQHTCHPVLTSLSTDPGTNPKGTKHCKHAVTSPEKDKTVQETKDTYVVCHDECAYGVGFDGAKKYAYMGCKSGCQALIDGKKTEKNGKADATCKACTNADTCNDLEHKPAIPKIDPSKKDDTPNKKEDPSKKDPKKDGSNSRASFTAVSAAASTAVLAFLYAGSK